MNIILLSGGSGKRLWPLSNDVRSKQFIKIFNTNNGYESMLQRIYKQIKEIDENISITIATSKSQVSCIHNQLGDNVDISIEPFRRDTFPAIALATLYLYDVKKIDKDETIVVCPVDPYVEADYFKCIHKLNEEIKKNDSNIVLMGINPTYPSEKYGYIIPQTNDAVSIVKEFKEKPNEAVAKKYIELGALWNGGVFAFKLNYLINKAHELINFVDYYDLFNKYESLNRISFDYAVIEKERKIKVVTFNGKWMDIGTWNTFTDVMHENTIGDVVLNDTCINTNVINELNIPILCMGLKNMVISISPGGILVSDKDESCNIKKYVDNFDGNIKFAEKSWGTFTVIDEDKESLTIKIILKAGDQMNYHSHDHRNEIWTIVSGQGYVVKDDSIFSVKSGDVITIPIGSKHMIISKTEMKIIEVQVGKDISVQDKKKYHYDYTKLLKTNK